MHSAKIFLIDKKSLGNIAEIEARSKQKAAITPVTTARTGIAVDIMPISRLRRKRNNCEK
jgi:hypothetical protein